MQHHDRITGLGVAAVCRWLGIAQDGHFDFYDVKEIGSLR